MFSKPLPRFVIPKTLSSGATAFYFNVPALYRKLGCAMSNEPLGTSYAVACGENGEGGRAARSMPCSMNGTPSARAAKSPLAGSPLTAPSIGCSGNTSRARPTSKRSPLDHVPTMNGRCS